MAKIEKPDVIGIEEEAGTPKDMVSAEQPIKIEAPPGQGEAPKASETKPEAESRMESSGFLRNTVDRVKLWWNKSKAGGQEGAVKRLTEQKAVEEKKAAESKKDEEKIKDEIKKAEEMFKKIEGEPAGARLGNAEKEVGVFQNKAAAALERAKALEEKIEGVKEKADVYREKVEDATGRVENRFVAKQEKNNESIGKLKIQSEGLGGHVKIFDSEIDKLTDQKKELEEAIKENPHKKVRETYEKKLLEIQKMISGLEGDKKKFEDKRDLADAKIKNLESANKDLQNKREELRPELKNKGGEAAPAEADELAKESEIKAEPEVITDVPSPVIPAQAEIQKPVEVQEPLESRAESGDTRALELKILDLEEEKERLESMDLSQMVSKVSELTPAEKKAYKKMLKTGKLAEPPKGTPESEVAGAELNRIFQRIPQVNKELADLRRQLKRAQLGGGMSNSSESSSTVIPAHRILPVAEEMGIQNPSEAAPEAPADLPIVEERPSEAEPPIEQASAALEKSAEKDIKEAILKKIEESASDKDLEETVDYNRKAWYDDDFENKYIAGVQENIDLCKKMGKEEFLKQFDIEGAKAENFSDEDFEAARAVFVDKFIKLKKMAEKALKEKPNPRPEERPFTKTEEAWFQEGEKSAEPAKESEKSAEAPVEEDIDLDAIEALGKEIEDAEKKEK